LIEEEEE